MRLFVKVLAGVAIAIVLLLAIVAVIVATIDTRTLLTPLEAQLEKATGRDVALGSGARITLSLTPTLVLDDVTIGNASWGSAKEMVRAKRVEAQVALLPLLSRRVDIVRFTLVEPVILLETDAAGRGNWSFGEATASTPPSDPVTDAGGAFALGEFAIEKGELKWRDGRTGEVTPVRIERLYLRGREPGKPIVAEFAGTIDGVPLALEGHFGPLAALRAKQWPWPVSLKGDVGGRKTGVEAKVREVKDGIEASDFALEFGSLRVRGTVTYATRGKRPHIVFDLKSDSLSPSDLALAGAAAARSPAKPAPQKSDDRLFASTPLPLGSLRAFDAQGTLAIGKLVLDEKRTLTNVRAKLALADGKLDVSDLAAGLHGGQASGRLTLDASNEKSAIVTLRLDGKDLDLASMLAAYGVNRDIRGGKTQLALDVNARGDSLRAWAASLTGTTTVRVGPARWSKSNAGLSDALLQIVTALDPFRASSSTTELTCAAIRLPFASGVAKVNRSIGVETDRLGISASGTIDLRNETLNLTLAPRVKDRAGIDLSTLAGAVRVQGPLAAPGVAIDPAGSIAAAAQIGALAQGGRAALLAGVLGAGPAKPGGPGECAVALGATAPAAAPSRAPQSARRENEPAREVERALGKLLGR